MYIIISTKLKQFCENRSNFCSMLHRHASKIKGERRDDWLKKPNQMEDKWTHVLLFGNFSLMSHRLSILMMPDTPTGKAAVGAVLKSVVTRCNKNINPRLCKYMLFSSFTLWPFFYTEHSFLNHDIRVTSDAGTGGARGTTPPSPNIWEFI